MRSLTTCVGRAGFLSALGLVACQPASDMTSPGLGSLTLTAVDAYVPASVIAPLLVDQDGRRRVYRRHVSENAGQTYLPLPISLGELLRVRGWSEPDLMVETNEHVLARWEFRFDRLDPLRAGIGGSGGDVAEWGVLGENGPLVAIVDESSFVYALSRDDTWTRVDLGRGSALVALHEAGDTIYILDATMRLHALEEGASSWREVSTLDPDGVAYGMPDGRLFVRRSDGVMQLLASDGTRTDVSAPSDTSATPSFCNDGTIAIGEEHSIDDGATWQHYPAPSGLRGVFVASLQCLGGERAISLGLASGGDRFVMSLDPTGAAYVDEASANLGGAGGFEIGNDGTIRRDVDLPLRFDPETRRWWLVEQLFASPYVTPSGARLGERAGVLYRAERGASSFEAIAPSVEDGTAIEWRAARWMTHPDGSLLGHAFAAECVGPRELQTCTSRRWLIHTRDDASHVRVLSELTEVRVWRGSESAATLSFRSLTPDGTYETSARSDTLLLVVGVLPDGRVLSTDAVSDDGATWTHLGRPADAPLAGVTPGGRVLGYERGVERVIEIHEGLEIGRAPWRRLRLTPSGPFELDTLGRVWARCGATVCISPPVDLFD